MADPRRPSTGSRQFMFIEQDADRSMSSEAIRVHVMRESHRARRQLRGLMRPTDRHGQMTIFPSTTPSRSPRRGLSREPSRSSADQSPSRDEEFSQQNQQPETFDIEEMCRLVEQRRKEILTTTPPHVRAAVPGINALAGLPNNIIELCGRDAGALHALLALVTCVQHSVILLEATEYESSALEILRKRLAAQVNIDHADETLLTVFLLSRLERVRMNHETAGYHETALRRMIQARGGLDALASSNEALVTFLGSYALLEDT